MTGIKHKPEPGQSRRDKAGINCLIKLKTENMEAYIYCQSCGMPMSRTELMGTEKDSSKSTIYCIYCYRDGEFYKPDMTIREMKEHVRAELRKSHASESVISSAIDRLPSLSRWLGIPAIHHTCEWH
jgi:hypothetical protein